MPRIPEIVEALEDAKSANIYLFDALIAYFDGAYDEDDEEEYDGEEEKI